MDKLSEYMASTDDIIPPKHTCRTMDHAYAVKDITIFSN